MGLIIDLKLKAKKNHVTALIGVAPIALVVYFVLACNLFRDYLIGHGKLREFVSFQLALREIPLFENLWVKLSNFVIFLIKFLDLEVNFSSLCIFFSLMYLILMTSLYFLVLVILPTLLRILNGVSENRRRRH